MIDDHGPGCPDGGPLEAANLGVCPRDGVHMGPELGRPGVEAVTQEAQTGEGSVLFEPLDRVPVHVDHSVPEVVDGLHLQLVDGGGPPGQGQAEDGRGHGDVTHGGQVVTEDSLQQSRDQVGQVGFGRKI